MPSADVTEQDSAAVTDEARESLLEAIASELGDAVVESHLQPGQDLWIRVATDAWGSTADYLRNRQRFRFFNWLSAIDWQPSPFGRSMDSEVEKSLGMAEDVEEVDATLNHGVTGGSTRFQVIARVHSLTTHLGVTIKADVPDDTLSVASWTSTYPGANWHEREAREMFGINFDGHPMLANLYLPASFEGYPLRKDFPLLARIVKPWPGIVDVEPMPDGPSAANPEDAQ